MGEKRKPEHIFLLKKQSKESSKTSKLEFFPASLWGEYNGKKWRIRVNGKWFRGGPVGGPHVKNYFTKWEIRDLIFKSYKF